MIALECCVEYSTKHCEYANLLENCYSHQDTKEEHDGRKVYLRKQIAYALGHRVIIRCVVVENLCNCPQQSQNQQNAHEWRQMSNSLEDGHKAETTNTKPEDDVTLRLCELAYISLWKILLLVELALKLILQDKCRYKHRNKRRNKDFSKHTLSGDNALNPEHDGGNVANRRESTS